VDRRQFITSSGAASGSLVCFEGTEGAVLESEGMTDSEAASGNVGRPVRAVSIGFKPGLPLEQIAALVDQEGARGADIIALPETFRGESGRTQEPLNGPSISTIGALASKHRTYIVCPINRTVGDGYFNSAVLLDRRGQIAAVYDKMYCFAIEKDAESGQRPRPHPLRARLLLFSRRTLAASVLRSAST